MGSAAQRMLPVCTGLCPNVTQGRSSTNVKILGAAGWAGSDVVCVCVRRRLIALVFTIRAVEIEISWGRVGIKSKREREKSTTELLLPGGFAMKNVFKDTMKTQL